MLDEVLCTGTIYCHDAERRFAMVRKEHHGVPNSNGGWDEDAKVDENKKTKLKGEGCSNTPRKRGEYGKYYSGNVDLLHDCQYIRLRHYDD
jgi:hypothetical protein